MGAKIVTNALARADSADAAMSGLSEPGRSPSLLSRRVHLSRREAGGGCSHFKVRLWTLKTNPSRHPVTYLSIQIIDLREAKLMINIHSYSILIIFYCTSKNFIHP